jgi:hypothetical protein
MYFVVIQIFNAIFESRDNKSKIPVPAKKTKMFFDMVKVIKQNPVSKRNGVEKLFALIINYLNILA